MLASCVYHIWKERNLRIFCNLRNSDGGVISCIENEIKLKLIGLRKMNIMVSEEVLQSWGILGSNFCKKMKVSVWVFGDGSICLDIWVDMGLMVNLVAFMGDLYWGYFRKGRFKGIDGYQEIDGLIHWIKSLLLNHVICTFGILYLDMIFFENIQMENPRHVIDAMSSLQLVLILWWFWCFIYFLFFDCRMILLLMIVKLVEVGIAYSRRFNLRSYIVMIKDIRWSNRGWIQELIGRRRCWFDIVKFLQWNLFNVSYVFWFIKFGFSMFGIGPLWIWFLNLHCWTVVFLRAFPLALVIMLLSGIKFARG